MVTSISKVACGIIAGYIVIWYELASYPISYLFAIV